MAGTIVADTLTHSTAGSLTTDYVVNGSAKAWVNFNGTGTIAARDSLNLSSLTDNGTGDYTVTVSNAFANANYGISGLCGHNATNGAILSNPVNSYANTTTAERIVGLYANGANYLDYAIVSISNQGDLA